MTLVELIHVGMAAVTPGRVLGVLGLLGLCLLITFVLVELIRELYTVPVEDDDELPALEPLDRAALDRIVDAAELDELQRLVLEANGRCLRCDHYHGVAERCIVKGPQ